jgi:hypothetical protein
MSEGTEKQRPRQFNLRALFLSVTLICVGIALFLAMLSEEIYFGTRVLLLHTTLGALGAGVGVLFNRPFRGALIGVMPALMFDGLIVFMILIELTR